MASEASKMKITKTLKPIIYKKADSAIQLVQKAVVTGRKKLTQQMRSVNFGIDLGTTNSLDSKI
jgi:hypothetical protein